MKKANPLDAGWDLVATHDEEISRDYVSRIQTGDYGDIPAGHVGIIKGRSGLAVNHGVFVLGGVIDSGYTGEIVVALSKVGSSTLRIKAGDRIAQMVVLPLSAYAPGLTSDRGEAGFGSTGQ